MSNSNKSELTSLLSSVGQTHLLQYWDVLDEAGRAKLAEQIKSIDWPQVLEWTKTAGTGLSAAEMSSVKPAPYKPLVPSGAEEEALYARAIKVGNELLDTNRVAAFTVAGGQGTRLGYDGPKGTYPVSPVRCKSLFQLFAEGILRTQNEHGTVIPWYIMTSVINHEPTVSFFKENGYFGLDSNQVKFFRQGMLPAFDLESGRALLEAKDSLALSPNGHGGSFMALKSSGALAEMLERGITTLSYWQVDNPMVLQFDPLFLGLHELTHSDMSSKALIKRDAAEKMGHFCLLNGKTIIIEYSDMPQELLSKTDGDGRLSFRGGSPAIHVLSTAFIDKLTRGKLDLIPHRALKKVPHLDENGQLVKPTAPNALKLEFFLFDALPMASSPLILEGDRENEFAPVKNPSGDDSPDSCRKALLARYARWFAEAGRPLPMNDDGTLAATVELSPARYGKGEDIVANSARIPAIAAGDIAYFD